MHTTIIQTQDNVIEDVQAILGTIPGKAFYSEDGEVLVLAAEGRYLISVEPPDPEMPEFNNGNPTSHSAYLVNQPASDLVCPSWTDDEVAEVVGWATGWTA